MNRSVLIYAAVLALSTVWAYITWTHEGEVDPDEAVVILDGKADSLVSIVYDSEDLDVSIEMRQDDHGRYAWADVVPKAKDEEAPEPDPSNPHAPPPPDNDPASFKVGKGGDKLLEGMAPFIAKRRLEGVAEDQLGELGLEPAEATLTITREGREPKTYELGGNAFGGVNVYVRDPADGKLYLLDAKLIAPLQSAKRTLPDRTLYPGEQKEIKAVAISDGSRTVTFNQNNPDDAEARFWAREGEDSEDATASAWLDKALSLSASEYLAEGEAPADLAPTFTITVQTSASKNKPVAVQILRGFDESGEESFFAQSPHTRGVVRLHRSLAADAAADLDSAFGGGGGEEDAAPE